MPNPKPVAPLAEQMLGLGLRIAEIGEHPVAHILGDKTADLGDEFGASQR